MKKYLTILALLTLAGPVSAAQISFVDIRGNWKDSVPVANGTNPAITNGVSRSTITWGGGSPKSGYVFTAGLPPTQILPPDPTPFFTVGTFTHNNFVVNPPSITAVKLDVVLTLNVDGVVIAPLNVTFNFSHEETPNAPPCPYPTVEGEGCTDQVTFGLAPAPQTFTVAGQPYTLQMYFEDAFHVRSSTFVTAENQSNVATLVGQFTAPPPASCGNYICDGTDSCSNCPGDCGICTPPSQARIDFSTPTINALESDGAATITVTRSLVTTGISTVEYATSNGTAQSGSDYSSSFGTLTFNAGEAVKTFQVSVHTDLVSESTETVYLTLSNPTGTTLGLDQAVLNIGNVNPPPPPPPPAPTSPEVQFSALTYTASENSGVATITVTRTGTTTGTSSVNFKTVDGSGIAGIHYLSVSGTLNFASNQDSKTFDVPLINDGSASGNKTVSLTLLDAIGASLGQPNPATLTITDEGSAPQAPSPFISELVPFSAPVNYPQTFNLIIRGNNFDPSPTGAMAYWNGTSLTVLNRSTTTITAIITPSLVTLAGAKSVTVTNPGGHTSNAVTFTVFETGTGTPPPFVVQDPVANPNPTYGATTNVSVLGGTFSDGGETALRYEWLPVGLQPGSISFSPNTSNHAKNATATFTAPGTYHVRVAIKDVTTGFTVMTKNLDIVVIARETSLTLSPKAQTITPDLAPVLRATIRDQFGNAMNMNLNWTASAGSLSPNQTQATLTVDATIRQVRITAATTDTTLSDTADVTVVFGRAGVGSLDQATVGPVPFKATSGLPGITFRNLNPGTRIRLFTTAGRHVQTIESGGNTEVLWDLTNTGSSRVSSGVYMFIMENGDSKKEGKVVLIL